MACVLVSNTMVCVDTANASTESCMAPVLVIDTVVPVNTIIAKTVLLMPAQVRSGCL